MTMQTTTSDVLAAIEAKAGRGSAKCAGCAMSAEDKGPAGPYAWFSGCYGPTDESHLAAKCELAWRQTVWEMVNFAGVADGDPAVVGTVCFSIERAVKHGNDMCICVQSNLGRGEKKRILVVTSKQCASKKCGCAPDFTPSSACKMIVRSMGSLLSEIQLPLKRGTGLAQVKILRSHARRVRKKLLKLR